MRFPDFSDPRAWEPVRKCLGWQLVRGAGAVTTQSHWSDGGEPSLFTMLAYRIRPRSTSLLL